MLLNIEAEAETAVGCPSSAVASKGCTPPRSQHHLYLLSLAGLAKTTLAKLATYIPTTRFTKMFCEMAKIKFTSAVLTEIFKFGLMILS